MAEALEDPLADARSPGSAGELLLAQARLQVHDLFEHSPWIYWTDFLLSLSVAYGAAALYLRSALFSAPGLIGFVIAAFALYRCGVFIHEIAHMPGKRLRAFRAAWNILFGIPTLMPSFAYKCHMDHHNPRLFGTARDGEYLALGAGPARRVVAYLLQIPVLPALAIFRFLLLTPVSFLHPRLRRLVLERASSFVINPRYRRPTPADGQPGSWIALELAIFVQLALFLALLIAGKVAWSVFAQLYVLGMAASGLNWVRTLAAHGYRNTGATMSFIEQIEDSNTVPGHPLLTELLFPVGLRYHSLHHLLPSLPYHSLGTAHRRLMAQLPADSPYRRTIRGGFLAATREMWGATGHAPRLAASQPCAGKDAAPEPSAGPMAPSP
ncbi:MAG TPA: fatty acid desaturase [Steroidobacteraceae bacterium]|nr:fatty acid desaturase [Steroidobacteraceae bacterium]